MRNRLIHLKHDWKAFTLFESILALLVNSFILLLILFIFQFIDQSDQLMNESKNDEWHIFLNQLEHDLEDKEIVSIDKQGIYSKNKNEAAVYSYVYKKDKIIRYKDGKGYMPFLMDVQNIGFTKTDCGISIEATFNNSQQLYAHLAVQTAK